MIKIEIPAGDKEAARVFGQALVAYSGITLEVGDQDIPPATKKVLTELKEVAGGGIESITQAGRTFAVSHRFTGGQGGSSADEQAVASAQLLDVPNSAPTHAQPASAVDMKGVEFNAEFCSEAKDPFYASGKNKGQWKRRKGVDEDAYDVWYDNALLGAEPPATEAEQPLETASAFGNKPAAPEKTVPQNCGEFMGWVSAQQAAEKINQIDIEDAYKSLNLQVTDLFPPNDEATVAQHVRNLHACLGGLE